RRRHCRTARRARDRVAELRSAHARRASRHAGPVLQRAQPARLPRQHAAERRRGPGAARARRAAAAARVHAAGQPPGSSPPGAPGAIRSSARLLLRPLAGSHRRAARDGAREGSAWRRAVGGRRTPPLERTHPRRTASREPHREAARRGAPRRARRRVPPGTPSDPNGGRGVGSTRLRRPLRDRSARQAAERAVHARHARPRGAHHAHRLHGGRRALPAGGADLPKPAVPGAARLRLPGSLRAGRAASALPARHREPRPGHGRPRPLRTRRPFPGLLQSRRDRAMDGVHGHPCARACANHPGASLSGGYRPMLSWVPAALDYIPRWIEFQMRLFEHPGCVIAVAHEGRIVLEAAFGSADLRTGEQLTPRHRFRVASHSKTFTAAGIMKLRERGVVGLDDKVGKHVPGLNPGLAEVSLMHLLAHSAGVVRDGVTGDQWFDRRPFADPEELSAALCGAPTIEPNTRFKYSNYGYGLLGRVIEAVTGEPYTVWMKREI